LTFKDKIYQNNLLAQKDSITTTFNKKLEAYESERRIYLFNQLSELKNYNINLYNQLKNVEGNLMSYINSKVQGKLDTLVTNNQIVKYSATDYGLKFDFNYKDSTYSQSLEGVSNFSFRNNTMFPGKTLLTKNEFTLGITYGIKEDNDKYQVFALSKSPYIKFEDLEGGYFLKKQITTPTKITKWHVGPYVGCGLNSDLNGTNFRLGWSTGVSVQYNILPVLKKSWWQKLTTK
jgi:hypothetical protein